MQIIDVEKKYVNCEQFFNSSIFEYKNKTWLAYRGNNGKYKCSIGICELDSNFQVVRDSNKILDIPPVYKKYQHLFEDPRIFFHKENIYCAYTNVNLTNGCQNQGVALLDEEFNVKETWYIDFGNNRNGASTPFIERLKNSLVKVHTVFYPYCEKNWQFFSHNDTLYFIYKVSPENIVVELTDKFKVKKKYKTKNNILWPFGEIRGGASPILVDGRYYSFFHSSFALDESTKPAGWDKGGRTYVAGVYTFKAEPPFELLQISRRPLLVGSFRDKTPLWPNAAIFPCCATIIDNDFYVSYGYNDYATKIMKASIEEINSELVDIN